MKPTHSLPDAGRRQFLKRSATAALLAGLPTGWSGRVFADDSPETPNCRCGA